MSQPTSQNPLLEPYDLFPYGRLKSEHLVPAVSQLVEQVSEKLGEMEQDTSEPTWQNTMGWLGECTALIEQVWNPASHYYAVNNELAYREAYEKSQKLLIPLFVRLGHSKPTYNKLVALRDSVLSEKMSPAQRTALDQEILARKMGGVHLGEEQKKHYQSLVQKLQKLSMKFGNNLVDRTKEYSYVVTEKKELAGLSHSAMTQLSAAYTKEKKAESSAEEGPWLIKLDRNSFTQIVKYADSRKLRQLIYEEYNRIGCHPNYDNTQIISEILKLRQEYAELLGFEHFADVSLATKMARSVAEVQELHLQMKQSCLEHFAKHVKQVEAWKLSQGDTTPFADWDFGYWSEQLKKELYEYDPAELQEYLPYEQVRAGLFSLLEKLFAIEMRLTPLPEEMLWDPQVECWSVYDCGAEEPRARLFIDAFARPGSKNSGAWMAGMRNHHVDRSGKLHQAIAYVVCNFSPPTKTQDSLLSWYDVETLFHEFGHALQQVLSTVEVASVSGTTGVKWDVVELPSQFMENWCYHKPTVMSCARHYKTQEPLPDELYDKVIASKNHSQGFYYLAQISMGMVDMKLHSEPHHQDPEACLREIFEQGENLHWSLSDAKVKKLQHFGHIFSTSAYAAGYYSYLWARVMSADAFALFEEVDLQNEGEMAKMGRRFRDTVLALGGSEDPGEVYRRFAGRDATIDALLRHNGLSKKVQPA